MRVTVEEQRTLAKFRLNELLSEPFFLDTPIHWEIERLALWLGIRLVYSAPRRYHLNSDTWETIDASLHQSRPTYAALRIPGMNEPMPTPTVQAALPGMTTTGAMKTHDKGSN